MVFDRLPHQEALEHRVGQQHDVLIVHRDLLEDNKKDGDSLQEDEHCGHSRRQEVVLECNPHRLHSACVPAEVAEFLKVRVVALGQEMDLVEVLPAVIYFHGVQRNKETVSHQVKDVATSLSREASLGQDLSAVNVVDTVVAAKEGEQEDVHEEDDGHPGLQAEDQTECFALLHRWTRFVVGAQHFVLVQASHPSILVHDFERHFSINNYSIKI